MEFLEANKFYSQIFKVFEAHLEVGVNFDLAKLTFLAHVRPTVTRQPSFVAFWATVSSKASFIPLVRSQSLASALQI